MLTVLAFISTVTSGIALVLLVADLGTRKPTKSTPDTDIAYRAIVGLYGMVQESKQLLGEWKDGRAFRADEDLIDRTNEFLRKPSTSLAQKGYAATKEGVS